MKDLSKQELRKQMLDLIKNQKEDDRLYKSHIITNKIMALPVFQKAKTILAYASFQGEVDTSELMARSIETGKTVVLPVVQKETKTILPVSISCVKDLRPGAYGILEPPITDENIVDVHNIDCILVPGVAFDSQGNRLGRGAGFYDRFLYALSESISTIGLAFDFQIVPTLFGLEAHDHPVNNVITN